MKIQPPESRITLTVLTWRVFMAADYGHAGLDAAGWKSLY
jgi:hypothetical protein